MSNLLCSASLVRLLITAACVAPLLAATANSQIVISEIMYNPDGSDAEVGATKEWVEIYNTGRRAVDLSGWTLEDLQDQHVSEPLPQGLTLAPAEALILTPDAAAFHNQWRAVTPRSKHVQVASFPSLANSPSAVNETVALRNSSGQVVDQVNYDDELGWPSDSPDGSSIMLTPGALNADANGLGQNWKPSMGGVYGARFAVGVDGAQERGSPGFVETVAQSAFEPSADAAWSMVVLPDTQAYVKSSEHRQIFDAMTQWIVDHHDAFGVQFVLHEGDIVNQNSQITPTSGDQTADQQWRNAKRAMSRLDGVVPYAFAPGNHDYGATSAQDRSTQFNDYFRQSDNRLVDPLLGGTLQSVMAPGELDNALHEFTAPDGRQMLVLATEWGPRQQAVDWANRTLRQTRYASHTAVLLTHAYMDHDETRLDWSRNQDSDPTNDQGGNPHAYPTSGDTHDGEELWRELVSLHRAFEMVFSGHIGGDGVGYLASRGQHGQTVHQMLLDTQFETSGGNGWLRVVEFLDDGRTVRVRTYSPWHDLAKTNAANAFEYVISPLRPGDYNGDGAVDTADYSLWRDSLGQSVPAWSAADGDGDGVIGDGDYDVWRQNFGSTRSELQFSPTPSPGAATLWGSGVLLLVSCTNRPEIRGASEERNHRP